MEFGDVYYYVTDKGTIGKAQWLNGISDKYRMIKNNCFTTYDKAEKHTYRTLIRVHKSI